jgi:hypothetical protein
MWVKIARRTTFFLTLITIGAITVSCFHLGHNSSWARTGGANSPGWQAFGTFAWGADSLVFVLGAWLAGRSPLWRTWSGRLRAVAYLFAFTYGCMLFDATQILISGPRTPDGHTGFRWPGTLLQDYAYPSLNLLTLLMLVWLLVPVFTFTRSRLTEKDHHLEVRSTFSIASILGWTTVATLILMWVKFLTWKGVAPETAYSFMTPTHALAEYFREMCPSLVITAAATLLVMWGWSGRWWLSLVALAAALLVDSFGHTVLFAILRWVTGESNRGNILTGSALQHWSFIAGRNCIVWLAFGVARATGVQLFRSPQNKSVGVKRA